MFSYVSMCAESSLCSCTQSLLYVLLCVRVRRVSSMFSNVSMYTDSPLCSPMCPCTRGLLYVLLCVRVGRVSSMFSNMFVYAESRLCLHVRRVSSMFSYVSVYAEFSLCSSMCPGMQSLYVLLYVCVGRVSSMFSYVSMYTESHLCLHVRGVSSMFSYVSRYAGFLCSPMCLCTQSLHYVLLCVRVGRVSSMSPCTEPYRGVWRQLRLLTFL